MEEIGDQTAPGVIDMGWCWCLVVLVERMRQKCLEKEQSRIWRKNMRFASDSWEMEYVLM